MTIKDLFNIIIAANEEISNLKDVVVLIETPDECWLELDTLQFTEDGLGRQCLVMSSTGGGGKEEMN